MPISAWSTTPANNNSSPPNGWPENMAPSAVNDTARQQMADHKTQWLDAEWFNHGDTVSRASATTFKIATDVTARYAVNRRIKAYDASTIYATITASSYSAPDTTITVATDSGSLSASLSSVALAIISPTNLSVPATIGRKGADVASAATTDLSNTADFVDVTGTTTITALGTVAAGVEKTVRFTGALTLTHHATSLILPGTANITTAANDTAIFRSLGSGNWLCICYKKADGTSISGSTVTDTTALVQGSADSTKKWRVETDGFTTGTTWVHTPPNCNTDKHFIQRASIAPLATFTTTSTGIPRDNTKPQSSEGTEVATLAITPRSTSHILEIEFDAPVSNSSLADNIIALFQDATADALAAAIVYTPASATIPTRLRYRMTAGTTSATTFKIRVGTTGGTLAIGDNQSWTLGGIMDNFINFTVTEYSA